jgi:integrase
MPSEARARSKLNRHLYLRNGVWWTRVFRKGVEHRESTGCPKSEIVRARDIRNERLGRLAATAEGVEAPGRPLTLGELLETYLSDECQPYDRQRGGEQPGTKRNAKVDRIQKDHILRHLPASLSTARMGREHLLELAEKREREKPTPAPVTRRNTFAFLRRVFAWAVEHPTKTGVTRSPFAELTREARKRLFPRGEKRGFLFSPEMLRAIYAQLPFYEVPFVRFAVHTGMRLREITTLAWGNVDLERGIARVEARFAKNGRARDVALGRVATSILSAIRPTNPGAGEHVFLGRRGKPILDVRGGFDAAVLNAWRPTWPGEKKPRFHDLRKTGATRVEAVSSHAVAKAFLGHADENVTDTYLLATLEAVLEAVNRAERSIDGEAPAGAIPFPMRRDGTKDGTPVQETAPAAERSVSNPHA